MGKPDVVPYIPIDPNQCTGGGGIISGHVYDDYIYELNLDNITLDPGLTFVNITVEWDVNNQNVWVTDDLTIKFYTHHYSNEDFSYIIDKSSPRINGGTGGQAQQITPAECIYINHIYVDENGTTSVMYTPEIYSYSMNKKTEMNSSDRRYSLNAANINWTIFNNGQNDISGPDVNKFKIIEAKSVIPKE